MRFRNIRLTDRISERAIPSDWSRIVVLLCLGVAMLAGCQAAVNKRPLPTTMFANNPGDKMDFWHTLPDRNIIDNNEAFHALLLFFDGKDPAKNYQQRVELLRMKKMLPGDFDRPANESVTRGVLAVALVRALHIKGGLTMHLIGPTQRYATRELVYMQLYPPSSPQQTFSGADFIGIIGRAEDYQREQQQMHRQPAPHVEPPINKVVATSTATTQPG